MPFCKVHGELPDDRFYKPSAGRSHGSCKECGRKKARENRKARYHDESTKKLIKEQNKEWSTKNAEYLSDKFKDKYYNDPIFRGKVLSRVLAYQSDHEAHELKRERAAQSWQRNKHKIYAKIKEKQAKHPELKLRGAIRSRVWGALKNLKDGESTTKYLPYSLTDLKIHIESQFEDWMCWDNWGSVIEGKRTWQIDHVVPQRLFPYTSMDSGDFLLCWSLDNLRPLESSVNFKEGDRNNIFGEFKTFNDFINNIRDVGYTGDVESVELILNKLFNVRINDKLLPQPYTGLSYLDSIFKKRFSAKTGDLDSFEENWGDDLEMVRVISYIIKDGKIPNAKLIASNMKFNSSMPSHFYPSAASALVKLYASGGSVIDPFLGWGGRTLGAICGGASLICGTDLQVESVEGCKKVVEDFRNIRNVESEFINCDFKSYLMNTQHRFDLLMTSPPFMNTESYGVDGHSDTRSWNENIVHPLVFGAKRVVKTNGFVAVHGQDRAKMPVLTSLNTAFVMAGFEKVAEYRYGKTKGQSVLVFKNV